MSLQIKIHSSLQWNLVIRNILLKWKTNLIHFRPEIVTLYPMDWDIFPNTSRAIFLSLVSDLSLFALILLSALTDPQ